MIAIRIANTVEIGPLAADVSLANASTRPTSSPPSIAPGMLPIPPTTAAVKPFRPARKPMKWKIWLNSSANMTPAAPASTEPMKNVQAITRSMSMPIIAAASRSNAVARIAFPSLVRATSNVEGDHQRDRRSTATDPEVTPAIVNTGSISGPAGARRIADQSWKES